MKKLSLPLSLLLIVLSFFSCQNSGVLVKSASSLFCPACKSETTTLGIKGMSHTKYLCSGCETVTEYYSDSEVTVHSCSNCGRAIEKCSICKRQ